MVHKSENVCPLGCNYFDTVYCFQWGETSGIISPILFNVYMDDLSIALNSSGIGGYLGAAFLNHLCYVSSNGMQQLLNICQNYATNHQLLYNGAKSFSLCFKDNTIKIKQPSFFLNDFKIPMVENCRYLGITISTKNSDLDLKRHMRKIYANANLLLRKFSSCSVSVKCHLFKTYCSTLYCAPMSQVRLHQNCFKETENCLQQQFAPVYEITMAHSASEMFVNLNIYSFDEMLRIFTFGFMSRVNVSNNQFISSIYNSPCRLYSNIWTWWDNLLHINRVNL